MSNISYYMSWVMVITVLLLALWAVFSPSAELFMPGNKRYWMGAFATAYATFRIIRLYRTHKSFRNDHT